MDSFIKLDPRHMMGNPVMFVVEIGSVITTVLLIGDKKNFGFNLQITLWLWFTVLFANFAEAMAEGRGKAQADTLRKARSETIANRVGEDGRAREDSQLELAGRRYRGCLCERVCSLRWRDHRRRRFGR
jgi:potassium-transporting ATPase ATP-binding subunit